MRFILFCIAIAVILGLAIMSLTGCCHIEYPVLLDNGKVAYAKYDRWFNQEITAFNASKDANGLSVKFDKQKSDTEIVFEAFNMGMKVGQSK